MAVIEIARIQVRRGQENQTGIPLLSGGEFAWGADTENLYIGLRREDGGARDANVRILTENDLRLFSSFIGLVLLLHTHGKAIVRILSHHPQPTLQIVI
jgi:hypothetical protein